MIGSLLARARETPCRPDRTFLLGERGLRVRFGGPALEEALVPALSHLPSGTRPGNELTIHALDGEESRFDPEFGFPGARRAAEEEAPRLFSRRPDGFAAWEPTRRALTAVADDGREALCWVPGPGALDLRDRNTPFRLAVHRWLRTRSGLLAHGSAVGTGDGGVLLTGPNGSGKSTAALACLDAGLRFAGDDQVILELEGPCVRALYSTAGLDTDHLRARLPQLAAWMGGSPPAEPGKTLFRLFPHHADRLIGGFPLRALVATVVAPAERTSLRPLSAGRALAALAPGTILQLPGAGKVELGLLADAARRVPAFELRLGADLDAVPGLLLDLLGGAGR